MKDVNPKTLEDLNRRAAELVEQGVGEEEVYTTMFKELVAYYNTLDGQAELMNSPHKTLRPTEAVALLMEDVRIISKRQKVKKEKKDKEEKDKKDKKDKKPKGDK